MIGFFTYSTVSDVFRPVWRLLFLGALLIAPIRYAQAQTEFVPLIQHSETQLAEANYAAAAATAARAYRVAGTPAEKLQASRLASAAHYKNKRFLYAQLWLRRAANHVTTSQDALRLRQEFETIRADSPLSVNLSFTIAPSDNVNGGAAEKYFQLGGFLFEFAPSSLALSGIEYSGQADLFYALSEDDAHVTAAGLSLYGRTYSLSPAAQDAAPGVSGSDYALTQLEASLSHRRYLFQSLGPTGVSVHLGKTWYGGDALRNFGRLALSQDFVLGQNAAFTLSGFVEDQKSLSSAQPDAQVYNLQGIYAQRLPNQDVVRVTLQSRLHDTRQDTFSYTDTRFVVDYERVQRLWDMQLSFSFGLGYKSYDEFSLSLNGRRDRSVSIGATATFEKLSYYGFSPSLNLTASRTQSNVARFTTNGLQARLGFESNF